MTIVRRRFPHDFTAETSRSGFSFWTTNETCFFFQTKQQSVQWVKKLQRCNELLHVLSHVYARWATGMGFIDCFDSKKHEDVWQNKTGLMMKKAPMTTMIECHFGRSWKCSLLRRRLTPWFTYRLTRFRCVCLVWFKHLFLTKTVARLNIWPNKKLTSVC